MRIEKSQLEPTYSSVLINILQHFAFGEAFSTAEVCSKQVARVVLVFVWGSFTAELQLPCSRFQHVQKIETSSLLWRATDRHKSQVLRLLQCLWSSHQGKFFLYEQYDFPGCFLCSDRNFESCWHTCTTDFAFYFFCAQLKAAFLSLDLWYLVFLSIKMLWEKTENILIFHKQYILVENWWMLMLNLNNASC